MIFEWWLIMASVGVLAVSLLWIVWVLLFDNDEFSEGQRKKREIDGVS